ncbi:hypothetical protein K491DRAFT_689319 [Lophiostoma macrostomum CBS 122681]|uniref:Glutamyl-tRNA amidotransferase complex subunit Gta3 domain-containing protein n=1 Tax=Lophiostoma macrostomum CBS 122681 TaxID=1314788 RepID=A0A6A6THI3_9PLEO|nr:hypothetical protein K491DRAFT_689319 [Lophiostoma macrostomum CBS 122681]
MTSRVFLPCSRLYSRASRCVGSSRTNSGLVLRRTYSQPSPKAKVLKEVRGIDLDELLAEPTWSVNDLLPPETPAPDAPSISPQQLHHLLRLSALPPPETPETEQAMIDTLSAQLHFVGEIQRVNTEGVEPLRALRDETAAAEKESTITLDTLSDALAQEKIVGKHHKRIQRKATPVDAKDAEHWDVLGSAERKAGRYFVVESERPVD